MMTVTLMRVRHKTEVPISVATPGKYRTEQSLAAGL